MLDLFSGIGGFAYAAKQVWGEELEIISFVEIDLFCQKVLKKNFPGVPIHDDIKTYKHDRSTINLLTGGFPCQPFSAAGKRRGTADDRYLWLEMLRVISEARPTWIIGENVAGILSMAQRQSSPDMEDQADNEGEGEMAGTADGTLWRIISDLKEINYDVQPFIIPACAVNAPHRRDRVWIVANSIGSRFNGASVPIFGKKSGQISLPSRADSHVGNTKSTGQQGSIIRPWEVQHGGTGSGSNWLEVATRLCRMDARIFNRVDRLKALGNAIVPQVVIPIMQGIKNIEGCKK